MYLRSPETYIKGHEAWYYPQAQALVKHVPFRIIADDSTPGHVHRGIARGSSRLP
ncbi:hypothetical protein K503DRAFT_764801, partial [Rhizopogon vinicolor AM-OR11-026]